jgi:hypothetical protein
VNRGRRGGPRPSPQRWRWIAAGGLALALAFVAASAAYQLAASRYGLEAERLRRDLATAREEWRRLNERTAQAEKRTALALARAAAAEQDRDTRLPRGESARLLQLVDERLAAGVAADRLASVIGRTRQEATCDPRPDLRRIAPRTPLATSALVSASFLDDRVSVAAQASAAPAVAGQPALFDAGKPVELRFTTIGGGIETARGLLPLGHAFVLQGRELRFLARASEKQPGMLEVSLQVCSFP